ncbi:MAG: alpha/beta fold hydrolase [Acutalibacteraceae bacterium]|nr:alpha/beta fold hydrolase [Acutalibacteraceae bacterium]
MKKFISVILALILVMSCSVTAFAGIDANATRSQIPVIRISGDGEALYNSEGERIMHFRGLLEKNEDEEEDDSGIYQSIANVLLPFLIEGIAFDKWDNYYNNLQKEIGELFGDALLDNNGNPVNGTGLSESRINYMNARKNEDRKIGRGFYRWEDYWFNYDWRLDPLYIADEFNDYIKTIKKTTGSDKVAIMASCLGTNIVTAYIAKYGLDDIHGITFDGGVAYGSEVLSETISGKFKLDGNAIERVLIDCANYDLFDVGSFVLATVDLLTASGALDAVKGVTKEYIYYKVIEGVTSALALSTFFTWPNYWATVTAEDYDTAIEYVFGEEGSEKREEYAGLIEKLDNYDKVVRQNIPEIMQSIKDAGVNLGIIAKYGSQMIPVCESSEMISDQIASVYRASYGATTSTVYEPLPTEYVAQRIDGGFGKYISPDKQIDASTCMFPDNTWFYKGATHSNWTSYEMKIMYDVATADRQLTVDDFEWGQFIVYDDETDTAYKMTEDNCHTEAWEADKEQDAPDSPYAKLFVFIKSIINWFRQLLDILSAKLPAKE